MYSALLKLSSSVTLFDVLIFFLGDTKTGSPWALDFFASLQICGTLDLWMSHALAVRSWHFEKLSLLHSPSDAYLLEKLYILKTIFWACLLHMYDHHYYQHHCLYFAHLRTCEIRFQVFHTTAKRQIHLSCSETKCKVEEHNQTLLY
jgi:hypothetical protein